MEMRLDCLKEGQKGKITGLRITAGLRRRLQDFGLTEGTVVCCMRKNTTGDLAVYCVRETMLALRRADSSRILVEAAI